MNTKSITVAILLLILQTASPVWATPYFEVDQSDRKDHYQPSDWITINIAIEDNLPRENRILGLLIDAISDYGAGGTAAEPQVFNTRFTAQYPGNLNSNGMLVEYMAGYDTLLVAIGADGILYSFEYHVPDVPYSTIITINTFWDDDTWLAPEITYLDGGFYNDNLIPVEIHVVPEPATVLLLGLGATMLRRRGG